MFLRTLAGGIVNMAMVGHIYLNRWEHETDVVAETSSSNPECPAVYAILFTGTDAQCREYIEKLFHSLVLKGYEIEV